MAVQNVIISPADTSHNDQGQSQGVWTSDLAYGSDGQLYKWTGAVWELQGGGGGGAGAGSSPSYPKFDFDWTKAREDAMTQLTPYYEQKLKEAGGDVERAKRLIEEDYTRGVRYSKEDLATTTTTAEEDAASAFKTLGLDVAQETRDVQGSLNRRGVLLGTIREGQESTAAPTSDYAKTWYLNPLEERQGLRKLAIERALKRQKEVGGTTATREQEGLTAQRTRRIEEQDIEYPRTQRDLEEEKRRRAFETVAPMKYSEEYAKYRAINQLG